MAKEKRLIDANALEAKIEKNFRKLIANQSRPDLAAALWQVGDMVIAAPTIDAVNRDGCKWCNGEYHTKIMATAIRYHTNGNMDGYELKVNYCPNCGADMRERKDNERKAD